MSEKEGPRTGVQPATSEIVAAFREFKAYVDGLVSGARPSEPDGSEPYPAEAGVGDSYRLYDPASSEPEDWRRAWKEWREAGYPSLSTWMATRHQNPSDASEPEDWRKGVDNLIAWPYPMHAATRVALRILADRIQRLEQGR